MTAAKRDKDGDSAALWRSVHARLKPLDVTLGRASSNAYLADPKMIGFMAARYKFAAKMLAGRARVLEIGCGDGFGAPFVAQAVGRLLCTDIVRGTLRDAAKRLKPLANLSFDFHDFRARPHATRFDGALCVDVLEHVFPAEEAAFLGNVAASLTPDGVLVLGTPNRTAEAYASEFSKLGHVNTKTQAELVALMRKHFRTVFPFGMNDEVLHTGYAPMCHYLWALCVGPKPVRRRR
jgi:2-polyprenyl-3-methyl-5-hydroxy-6-metoxy-1,4-benzoquinol methylase